MFSNWQRGHIRRTSLDVESSGGIGAALKAATIAVGGGPKLVEPRDPSFVSLRAQIDALVAALSTALTAAAAADATWAAVAADQAAFADAVAAAELDADAAPSMARRPRREDVADDGVAGTAVFARAVADNAGPGPGGRKPTLHYAALDQVRRYVEHLRSVQARVKDLAKAHTDFVSAETKLRTHENKAAVAQVPGNPEVTTRLLEKRDLNEKMYRAMLSRLNERMTAALAKKENALALLRSAFWLQQARLQEALCAAQQAATDAARATEPLLVSVSIMSGLQPPNSMYAALNPRPVKQLAIGMPPSTS
jgi:hypothetical protein